MGNYCSPPSSSSISATAASNRHAAAITAILGQHHENECHHHHDAVAENVDRGDDQQPILSNVAVLAASRKRPRDGTGRLRDAGFEFRLVPCDEHYEQATVLLKGEAGGNEGEKVEIISTTTDDSSSCCCCFKCATRLFDLKSGRMITAENRKTYIPDGPVFDHVSDACQEIVQDRIVLQHSMKFITICNDPALGDEPIRALVNQDSPLHLSYSHHGDHHHLSTSGTSGTTSTTPSAGAGAGAAGILLIITGKGKSRAGIMSVKHVVESGMEIGSALYHLVEAKKRNATIGTIMLLDPNARGVQNGMDTVDRSLTFLFSASSSPKSPLQLRRPLYILAHSAAGGFLSRYLLLGQSRLDLLDNICALVFTDSTHRLPWARDDDRVLELLQSSKCLYIRNNSARVGGYNNNKAALAEGEKVVVVDVWWRQRFGQIETVWGGTCDHSLLCWSARAVIWNFLDKSQNATTIK